MLDIKYIRENATQVKDAVKHKQLSATVDIDALVKLHDRYLETLKKVETLRNSRNTLSENISKLTGDAKANQIKEATLVKAELEKEEAVLTDMQKQLNAMLLFVPNIPAPEVPVGTDDTGNVEIRTGGMVPKFGFTPKDHIDLGKSLGIIDLERGAKIAGFRGYFLKKEAADLSLALMRYAVDLMKGHGFEFMTAPVLVKPEYFVGTGYFPWGEADHYKTQDELLLAGTAEVALTSYYAGELLDEADLPVKIVGISPCFRREIGSYGKDTKGIFRVHEFTKVEQVVLVEANEDVSKEWHETMLRYSEELLTNLGLPYRILLMCTGDMGAGQRKKYDIETWFPGRNAYGETHSASCFLDFQARRLNMRYRTKTGELKYVYTLNNTVAASTRLVAAILENYQQQDGSIVIPKALQPYTGFEVITRS